MKMKEQDKLTKNYLKVLGLITEEDEFECQKPGCDPECGGSDDPGCDDEVTKKSCRTRKNPKNPGCGEDETTINEAEGDEAEAEDEDEDERDPDDYDLFPDDPDEGESRKEDLYDELTNAITEMAAYGEIEKEEADDYYDKLHCTLDSADISEEDAEYWLNLIMSNGKAAKKLAKLITAIGRCE